MQQYADIYLLQSLKASACYGYHTSPAKPQRNTNTHRIQPMK